MKLLDLILNRNREARKPSVPASAYSNHPKDGMEGQPLASQTTAGAGASSDGMKYLSEMHQHYRHMGHSITLWDLPPVLCYIDGLDFPLRGDERLSMGRALQSAIHFINSDVSSLLAARGEG